MAKQKPTKSERSRRGTVAPSTDAPDRSDTATGTASDDDDGDREARPGARPDLDERERRQSPHRKAAGPGGPARPAPRPSSDADEAGDEPEPWGCDPTSMPPTEPVDPTS